MVSDMEKSENINTYVSMYKYTDDIKFFIHSYNKYGKRVVKCGDM